MKRAIPNNRGKTARRRSPSDGESASAHHAPVRRIHRQVDGWAAQQADKPGRSEAIRRLVELGLKAKAK